MKNIIWLLTEHMNKPKLIVNFVIVATTEQIYNLGTYMSLETEVTEWPGEVKWKQGEKIKENNGIKQGLDMLEAKDKTSEAGSEQGKKRG